MRRYVSSILCGLTDPAQKIRKWVDALGVPDLGLEFFCHTHIPAYMQSLEDFLPDSPRYSISLHGPFLDVEGTSAHDSIEQRHLFESYRRAFQISGRLGGRHIVFHTNERFITAENRLPMLDNCLRNLQVLAPMAAEYEQTLLVENLGLPIHGIPLLTDTEYIQLFSDMPLLGAIIDVGHGNLSNMDFDRVLKSLGDKVMAYHLHNNDGLADQHRRIREGTLDAAHVLSLCRQYSPGAALILEYAGDIGITPEQVLDDLDFILSTQISDRQ